MRRLQLLHRNASPESLAFFQLYVFGLWLIRVAFEPLQRLAVLPEAYYHPVGILWFVPDGIHAWLLTTHGLTALKGALVVSLALSLVPRAFRHAAPLASLLLLLRESVIQAYGVINHGPVMLLLAAIILAVFANLPKPAPSPTYNPNAIPLITVACVLTLSYSLVGVTRFHTQGFSIFTSDTILNYVVSRSLRPSYYDFNLGLAVVSWAPAAYLLRAGYPLVTLVECLSPLVLVSRWVRWVFIVVMIPFHVMTLVFMEVDFTQNLLLSLVVVDFSLVLPRLRQAQADPTSAAPVQTAG